MKLWLAIFEDLFWLIAIVFGILSAYQKWQDVRETKREKKRVKESYYQFWLKLRNTGILELPKLGVQWFLQLETKFSEFFERIFFFFLNKDYRKRESKAVLGIGGYITYVLIGFFVKYGWTVTLLALLPLIWMILFLKFSPKIEKKGYFLSLYIFTVIVFVVFSFWGTFLALEAVLTFGANTFGQYSVVLLFMVIVPLLGNHFKDIIGWLLRLVNLSLPEKVINLYMVFNFAYAAALSLFVTSLAFVIGFLLESNESGLYTTQFYLSNMLFDALTLLVTFFILKKATAVNKSWILFVGIMLDLVLATIFAFLSLYIGTAFSNEVFSFQEILYIFLGKNLENTAWSFGPVFWAMHSSFLPTFIYLFIIGMFLLAKTVTLPIYDLFYRGRVLESPRNLAAATFAFAATIFGAIAGILGRIANWI